MAIIKVPVNCGGITTVTSGAQVPVNQLVTLTPVELTDAVGGDAIADGGPGVGVNDGDVAVVSSNLSTGAVVVSMNPIITSITMNGNVYAVTNGISAPMLAVDATQLIYEGFQLVTG